MFSFLEALQFLTILRFKNVIIQNAKKLGSSTFYFPLIGAFLGIVLIIVNKLLYGIFSEPILSLILISILIILTGALHLDGLADTCDALFSGKTKERIIAIMHDTHKGTFGVIGILIVILFKINMLSSIPVNYKNLALFLMTVISRYSMVFAITFFPYARTEGKAKIFFENTDLKIFILSTLITLILLAITSKWISISIFLLMIVFTLIFCIIIKRGIGGLTGDTLGALCELSELIVLLFFPMKRL